MDEFDYYIIRELGQQKQARVKGLGFRVEDFGSLGLGFRV